MATLARVNETAPPESTPPASRRRWPVHLMSVLIVIAVAAGCAFILQYSMHRHWSQRSEWATTLSWLDVSVVTVLITCLWAVIGRLWITLALTSSLSLILAGINRVKIELREEPVFPSDRDFLSESGFFIAMVDTSTVVTLVVTVILIAAILVIIGWLAGRLYPPPRLRKPDGRPHWGVIITRLVVFLVTGGLLVHATNFNEPRNLWRALYEADGAAWAPFSQLQNYRNNGFVGGFLYNMPVQAMDRPEGYDADAMAQLAERYAERAEKINADRTGSLEDVNVVFVLSESFTDPSWMHGFSLDENPIPATQQIMSETTSGTMYAHLYGGGTATMEFESMTGQPVGVFRSQVSSPYQMFVADQAAYPSAVGAFSALGHHTVAIHAYNLSMYKRMQVYETLGFDEVVRDATMRSQERIEDNRYISDRSAFDEVLYHLDRNEDPVFVNLVTMQNHGAYHDFYSDPIVSDISDANRADEIGHYFRGLAHSDVALVDFLAELEARDETTIVVLYGDHHPGVYSQEILDANDPDAHFRTPFFVWSSESNTAQHIEAITPAMFLPFVYEVADAPVPPFVALLDDVRHSIPVIQHARTLDADGQPVDPENLDAETAALLEDLTMVQYDFSIGRRHAVDTMWPGALGDQ